MKPVDQTKFVPDPYDDECGNCLQAAYASILELPLEDVPHFAAIPGDDGEWWFAICRFVREHGYATALCDEPIEGAVGTASGKSPRGDFNHVVVVRGDEMIHDPHPSRAGLDGDPIQFSYLVALDPASQMETPTATTITVPDDAAVAFPVGTTIHLRETP